jgi:signal transduction histidine kinase
MTKADAIDRRSIYQGFAYVAWALGFGLLGWGPLWFGTELGGEPYMKAALVRVFAAIVVADGCFAAALASSDGLTQRQGVKWFAGAHLVVMAVLTSQRIAVLSSGPADIAISVFMGAFLIFGYLWQTADGNPIRPTESLVTLFTYRRRRPEATQSMYEVQIRKTATQEERNRLARDLHDSIKQQLFVIQTAAATAQTRYDSDRSGAKEALERVRMSAREAMTEMEVMLDQLRARPLENVGLTEALKNNCVALQHRTGAQVTFHAATLPDTDRLPPGAHEALYRVAQEALSNIARHARATKVTLRIGVERNMLQLSIQDDGSGFDADAGGNGMGMTNMRSRVEELGGEFEMASRPGGGVQLAARIPVAETVSAKEYLHRALFWSMFLTWWMIEFIKDRNVFHGVGILFAVVAVSRDMLTYFRMRKTAP